MHPFRIPSQASPRKAPKLEKTEILSYYINDAQRGLKSI